MLKILMAASEAEPYAKTGGMADVLGSLPAALIKQGMDVRVIMPKYFTIPIDLKNTITHMCYIFIKIGWRNLYCGIEKAEYKGVTYYFIDNEYYFKRGGFYGYGDDGERFSYFCTAVLEILPYIDFIPDVIHCHDWQTGMIPVLLETKYRMGNPYKKISTVFTIHNLKYRGIFNIEAMKDWFGLEEEYFTVDKLEFYGGGSFLKGGLTYSRILTTVSPSYAEEIRYPYYGERMDGLLRSREKKLFGILNGIDYNEFNPSNDQLIYNTYDKDNVSGKAVNKAALLKELNLPKKKDIPMIGMITRLVEQKGLDLVTCVLQDILNEDIQFVLLGAGDGKYEWLFKEAACRFPDKLSANIKFDNGLAHKIYAASDLFLMPSMFEPCGLGQMLSMRYGSLPIVRETGGLRDTVLSYNEQTGEGNGFSFTNYNAHEMLYTIKRAISIIKNKVLLDRLRINAMSCDYSWNNSANKYRKLYESI
jgi:starch synthase